MFANLYHHLLCNLFCFVQELEFAIADLYSCASLNAIDTKDPVLTLLARSLAWIAKKVAESNPHEWVEEVARRIKETEGANSIFDMFGKGLQFVVDQLGTVKVYVMFDAIC